MKFTVCHMVRLNGTNLYMPRFERITCKSKEHLRVYLREKEWDVQRIFKGHIIELDDSNEG